MNIGDTIQCKDPEDMVNTMYAFNREGIETDFMYEKDGVKGLWLEVVAVRSPSLTT